MAYGGVDAPGVSGMELEAVYAAIDRLACDIIMGEVFAPLTTSDGIPIVDDHGNTIMASRRLVTQQVLDQVTANLLDEFRQAVNASTAELVKQMDARLHAHDASEAAHPTHITI